MELDKFEQFVKDGEFGQMIGVVRAIKLLNLFSNRFPDQYEIVKGGVNAAIDFDDMFTTALGGQAAFLSIEFHRQMVVKLNELIVKTLEDIEDIEEYNKTEVEPEDPMDIIKRQWELGDE